MAISSAVHPVRVEKLEADQKVIKTVTIADPPTLERSNRCTHNQNQNAQSAKSGISSPGQTQDKKSILIKKRHLANDSDEIQSDSHPRRHSDDHASLTASKHNHKQTKHFNPLGGGNNATKSIRNTSNIASTDRKSLQPTIQRSSSLKNPVRKPFLQVNVKNLKDGNSNKRQSKETHDGNYIGTNSQKKTVSNPKRQAKSPTINNTKVTSQQTFKPSKKMCQPRRILRRSLTVPPLEEQFDHQEGKIDHSYNKTQVGTNKNEKDVYCQAKQLRNQECINKFPNLIERRKSYESLDVIDGRTITPVNTTARQRLLKEYMPRRRFSHGAIKPIREMLLEIEEEENRQIEFEKEELKRKRRDQQKKTTKKKSKKKNEKKVKRTITKNPKAKVKRQKQADIKVEEDDDSLCNTDDDFLELSREEQMERLQEGEDKSTGILEEGNRDWVGIRSLTGANASGWKFQDSFYGNFNVGRQPSMETAWGRRVYDQYEIAFEIDKPKHSYLSDPNTNNLLNFGHKTEQLERQKLRKTLGLWDVIFNREIVPVVESVRRWEAFFEEREKQLKKLNLDLATLEADDVATGDNEDPVNKFRRMFCKTGSYLRPDDMKYCISKTNFTEDQIIEWFHRFKKDCPNGRLTVDQLRTLFRQAYPYGDADKFSSHIMRIFDSDGNGFLDFKEFLMAIDIATCQTEESKLAWVFKLYDVDNDGFIDIDEMASVMETLESLEFTGPQKSKKPTKNNDEQTMIGAAERAKNLFSVLDSDGNGVLTLEEFIAGYMQRSILQAKQDAQEQKAKSDWLTFRGPHVVIENERNDFVSPDMSESEDSSCLALDKKLARHIAGMISKRIDIDVEVQNGDITYAGTREANENHPRFVLVRFQQQSMRDEIWKKRKEAKKNGIIIEEWLTDIRARLYKKCKELKSAKLIKDVITEDGDIYVVLLNVPKETCDKQNSSNEELLKHENANDSEPVIGDDKDFTTKVSRNNSFQQDSQNIAWVKKLVITDADYENLVKHTKNTNLKSCDVNIIA